MFLMRGLHLHGPAGSIAVATLPSWRPDASITGAVDTASRMVLTAKARE